MQSIPLLRLLVALLVLSMPVMAQTTVDSTETPLSSGSLAVGDSTIDTTSQQPQQREGLLATFFTRIGDDFVAQATSPARMDVGDLVWFGGGVATGLALYASDESLDRSVRDLKSRYGWIDRSAPIVTELGGTYGIAGVLLFSGYSIIGGTPRDRETTMMLGEVLVTTTVWSRAVKILTGRERPSVAYGHPHPDGGIWHGPLSSYTSHKGLPSGSFDAFPSGHTTTAFAIATIFAGQYNSGWVVPTVAYSLASLVGVTRMIQHAHWASDVFVGAWLGYLCGRQIVATHRPDPYFTSATASPRVHLRFTIAIENDVPMVGIAGAF